MTDIAFNYGTQLRESVQELARMAFAEDMPQGDITAEALLLRNRQGRAKLITREAIPFCGRAWFSEVLTAYHQLPHSGQLEVICLAEDGQLIPAGATLFHISGDVADLVGLERVLLNFVGRGIAIAKATHGYVSAVRAHAAHTQVLDTRKTLPGYRWFDKYAVLCGGGHNHRMNLSDQVLIKENHIARLGGVDAALTFVKQNLQKEHIDVQIEVTDLAQLDEALAAGCRLIMLDNFTPEQVALAMNRPRGEAKLEVSGGVTLETIGAYAKYQVDRISIGAITHSIKAPDLSLLVEEDL